MGEKIQKPGNLKGTRWVSNRLNLTFEPCYCSTQHVMRSYHKSMRAQVTWKVLYDRIAILKYVCVWLSRFCSLSVRLPSFHRSPKVSDCCLKTHTTFWWRDQDTTTQYGGNSPETNLFTCGLSCSLNEDFEQGEGSYEEGGTHRNGCCIA